MPASKINTGSPSTAPERPAADRTVSTEVMEFSREGPSAPALSLVGLQKRFGTKIAVDDLHLQVRPGCTFGLVGPNGAGKTTTLSMATGLLRPDAGTAAVLGRDVWSDPAAAKALIGVLPDGMRLFDRLSGGELLHYVGLLRRVPAADIASRSAELLDALGLTEDRNKLVVEYSAGMTKKIGLACALIHGPRLLILDEPFESVDPVSGEHIRAILRGYVRSGGTVVLSSHVMELVESLCDELAVVAQGRVLAAGTLDEVRAGSTLQQRFLELVGYTAAGEEALGWLRSSSGSN
jgi:ABC-2 type transport system ATP-binding protein